MARPSHAMQVVDFTGIEGWGELEAKLRTQVETLTSAAKKELGMIRESRVSVGEKLSKIRELLLPHKIWVKFLRTAFGWGERTGYRWIAEYEQASKVLPAHVLQIGIERSSKALLNLELMRKNPPPQTEDPAQIGAYFEKLEHLSGSQPKPSLVPEPNTDERVKQCLHFVSNHYTKIKKEKEKKYFMENLIGMELTKFGVSAMRVEPIAIPEEFIIHRGRPKEKAA